MPKCTGVRLLACAVLMSATSMVKADQSPVAFKLQDAHGAWHSLDETRESKLVVLAFVGTECPLADLYAPKLAALARKYEAKDVAFFAIDANQQDAPSALERFAKKHTFSFPILKDVGNVLADRLGAKRTPEVFVLDEARQVRYRGRIDDQFGIGVHRPGPTREDLASAVEDLLAGRAVAVAETDAVGCLIGRVAKPNGDASVNYSQHVARILRDRCVACHREGEIGPFALTSYQQAAGWAEMIDEVVQGGRMPPWHASAQFGKFANEARLTDAEKATIASWVAAGAPQGNPNDLPEPAHFVEGWRIPKPDLVVPMPKTVKIPANGEMPYQNFVIDPKLKSDVWVRASQVRPGNPSVVHHLVVFVLPPGEDRALNLDFLAAYSPGMPPRVMPEGSAKFVPAGSRLLFQLHYTPRGIPQTDCSEIGLVFADPATVRKQVTAAAVVNTDLRIPAGDPDFAASASHRFDQDTLLYSLLPHMHLRGKSFTFEAVYPDGRHEVLLDVPRYEFDWQNVYVLAEPKLMPEGTVLNCLARFDNSAQNLSNPDPTKTVRWGEQTNDEMLVGYIDFAPANQDFSLGLPTAQKREDGRYDVTFRYRLRGGEEAKTVYLAGTFNDWKPDALAMNGPDADGLCTATLVLDRGAYEYKFVLDGTRWRHDPANPQQVGFYHNSALHVGEGR